MDRFHLYIKRNGVYHLVYGQIHQIEGALKVLFRVGIKTNEQLYSLTEEQLQKIPGLGEGKIKAIQQLQRENSDRDVFRMLRADFIKPKRMIGFFNKLKLNSDNILTKKLHDIQKSEKLTKGKIKAFLEFKFECLRHKYNDTNPSPDNREQDDTNERLVELFLFPMKPYLSDEQLNSLQGEVDSFISMIRFENVDIEQYGEEIIAALDDEYFLGNQANQLIEDLLYQIIFKQRKEINLFRLKEILQPIPIVDVNQMNDYLQRLLKDGFIIYTPHGLKYHRPGVMDYIQNNLEDYGIVFERLQGKTLEEIGQERNLTRERIRQLEKKESITIPYQKISEQKYVPFFVQYDLSEDEFCKVFELNQSQFLYLKLYNTPKKQVDKLSKEELLESQTLTLKEQERLLEIINKGYLVIGNRKIKKNKLSIISYCVELYAKETMKLKEFHPLVIEFCEEYDLDMDFSSIRALEGILARVDALLWKYGKQFRFYNIEKELILSTLSNINFNQYNHLEISARRILDDYDEEFAQIDILDEYEMHNLLKKYQGHLPNKLHLSRMPLLQIGSPNREEQLLDLLIENSPISRDDFAELYSERYGILLQTVKANYLSMLQEYEHGDTLNANTPMVSQDVIEKLEEILIEEFYFKEDIYTLYAERFGEERLPDYLFSQLGYRNYAQFILKDTYHRADLYFEETYFNKEIFEVTDKRMLYLGSFRKRLFALRENLDVFEYDERAYIRFEKINEQTGIEKSDIIRLVQTILDEVGDRYFTVDVVQPIIERSALYKLGFDNIFYESILRGNQYLRFQYMANKVVFRRTKDKFYISNLVDEVVSRFKRIDIYDLIFYIDETYSVSLSKESIVQSTEVTELYYHPVMEMMFQDVEEFYEMMEAN